MECEEYEHAPRQRAHDPYARRTAAERQDHAIARELTRGWREVSQVSELKAPFASVEERHMRDIE
jgi:hypothetical protein